MQNTLWKLISVAGVVAIGTLVVVEVQRGLSSADVTTAGDAPPFENDEQLSDAETIPSDFEQQMAVNDAAITSTSAGSSPEFADTAPFAADDNGVQVADSGGQFTQEIALTAETETAEKTGGDFLNFAVDSSEEVSEGYNSQPLEGTTGDLLVLADDMRMQELQLGSIQRHTSSLADDANDLGSKNFSDDLTEPQTEPIPEPRMSLSQSGDVNAFEFYTPDKSDTASADSVSPFEMEEDVASSPGDLLSLNAPGNGIADSTPPGPMPVDATDNPTRFFDETNPAADDSLSHQELIPSNSDNAEMFGLEDSETPSPLPFVEEPSPLDIIRDRTSDPAETDTRDSEPGRVRLDSPDPLRLDASPPGVPERNSGRSQFNFDSTEEPGAELPFPADESGRSPGESPRDPVKRLRELPPQRTLPDRLRNLPPREEPAVRHDSDTIEIRSRGERRREEQPPARGRADIDLADLSSTGVLRPHVTVRKQMPRAATLGKPLNYTLVITNEGQTVAEDVIVEDIVPAEATLEGVAPPADYEKKTRTIIWELAELESGDSRELKVRITPTGQGVLKSVATVKFKTQATTSTIVHAPRLTLDLVAPREIRVGRETQLRYIVRNEGDGVATDVMLRSDLPAGLQHPIGNDLEYNIETLAPNDKREIVLDVIASEPGSHTSTAELIVSGANGATAEATVNIIGQQIQVARRGPERRYVGRSAIYENILSNETAFEASQIRVVEYVPDGMKFERATHNGIHNPEDRTVTWTLNQLEAGDSKTLKVQLVAMKAGDQESSVTVLEDEGFETEARHVTSVEDLHNIGSRMSRLDGPVSIGEEFGFDIAVQNRGTADATNLQLTIDLANGMQGVSVGKGGPRADPRMNNGQLQYDFQAIDRIGPGGEMIFRINLKATKSISNGLVKARIRYDQMQKELVMSEAVTAIDDTP